MGSFHRVDTTRLARGAARFMYAAITQAKPAKIVDVIATAAGPTQYDAAVGWSEFGATREGISISINNTEEGMDIDQIPGLVGTAPSDWECFVTTRLAEVTLESMVIAWEGAAITTDTSVTPYERETGFAGATNYTHRRVAVIFKKPTDKLLAFFFHDMVRSPQESTLDFRKGGDPQTLPIRLRAMADATETNPLKGFFRVREQI